MTITINTYFLFYWICAIVFETIYVYTLWKEAKKQMVKYPMLMTFKETFMKTAGLQLVYNMLFSPPTFILGFVLLCFASPLIFPFSLLTLFKKLIGYKSKLEKQADDITESYEKSKKESEEFMKNEDRRNVETEQPIKNEE